MFNLNDHPILKKENYSKEIKKHVKIEQKENSLRFRKNRNRNRKNKSIIPLLRREIKKFLGNKTRIIKVNSRLFYINVYGILIMYKIEWKKIEEWKHKRAFGVDYFFELSYTDIDIYI